jgi:acetylornithine deacetylase/succinyl-diaminopimelate desuccinylase-like protein
MESRSRAHGMDERTSIDHLMLGIKMARGIFQDLCD